MVAIFLVIFFGETTPILDLNGTWCNEKGSLMILKTEGVDGNDIRGTYQTGVGNAAGFYEVRGRRTRNGDGSQTLAFTVAWVNKKKGNSHSATAWSGQLQMISGQPALTTLWLLTRQSSAEDNWEATRIGKTIFTRCPPDRVP